MSISLNQDESSSIANLLDYCETPKQTQVIRAMMSEGSQRKAAKLLGVGKNTIAHHIGRVRATAASKGLTERMDLRDAVPQQTHTLGKMTVQLGSDGIEKVWARAEPDREKLQLVARELADNITQGFKPLPTIAAPRRKAISDRLAAYVIADLHLGMYAWKAETGGDYDCEIARRILGGAMQLLMERTPDTESAIIAQLGDYLHMTDETNETPRGKNRLDVDTRWKRVVRIGEELYVSTIQAALKKHKHVTVYNVRGNHDMYVAYMLGRTLQRAFAKNNRVTIVNPECDYVYHRFGNNLIGMTHGHLAKPQDLGDKMMEHRRTDVGECSRCYWWTGHIHHETVKRFGWYSHESFTTIAANDAHAAERYTSNRTMDSIVIDPVYGIRDRTTVTVDEIESLSLASK
ncbi:metallophosphoesterase family protein [Stieleria sp. JC731]|uniref:metallophosphoesterase family protein n=1 Tax=Pirellulaceae TaxID=2691357 RepID=UPI001E4EB4F2|nr:metallophosphoesterase family protein [Stieleria sp. JC731]MCC9603512.1 metallophosphoesterase family protein [Stieleria sp. JC731]